MIASILVGLAHIISFLLDMLMVLIIASAVISWVDASPSNQFVVMIRSLTEPMYRPFRKLVGRIGGPIDLSPMIVILIIVFLKSALPHYLLTVARQLTSNSFSM